MPHDYGEAKWEWAQHYGYQIAKDEAQNGNGYKNDVERWAKQNKNAILKDLLNDKKFVQQGNICGFDIRNWHLETVDW